MIFGPDLPFHLFDSVSEDMPLYDILNEFQKGHSHIAVVYKDLKESLKNGKEGETVEASLRKGVNIHSHSSNKRVYNFTLVVISVFLKFHISCTCFILFLLYNLVVLVN